MITPWMNQLYNYEYLICTSLCCVGASIGFEVSFYPR
jgi:hypothetical protein